MSMEMNVAQLLKAPIGAGRGYDLSGVVNLDGCESLAEGGVELVRIDRGILARGDFHLEIEATCSRCLGVYRCPVRFHFEEEYLPVIALVGGRSQPAAKEPGFVIDEHNILDLTEAVRQYALLEMPMKPLCSEDCLGLCPTCGRNLNIGPCACVPQEKQANQE